MKAIELKKELEGILPEYDFEINESGCIFGVLNQEPKTFRDAGGNLIKTKDRHVFVSSVMYKDNPKIISYRYAINYTDSEMRYYRCRSFYSHEHDKIYVSGYTDKKIIKKIREYFN